MIVVRLYDLNIYRLIDYTLMLLILFFLRLSSHKLESIVFFFSVDQYPKESKERKI